MGLWCSGQRRKAWSDGESGGKVNKSFEVDVMMISSTGTVLETDDILFFLTYSVHTALETDCKNWNNPRESLESCCCLKICI